MKRVLAELRGWQGNLALAISIATLPACGKQAPILSAIDNDAPITNEETQYVAIPSALLSDLTSRGFTFTPDHRHHPRYRFGYVPHSDISQLSIDAQLQIRTYTHLESLGLIDPDSMQSDHSGVTSLAELREGYHNYAQLTNLLQSTAERYSEIVRVESIGQSVRGRELWMARISANIAEVNESKVKLLYIANMHGDETVGREMMIKLIEELTSKNSTDPEIARLLQAAEIFIVPSMNPDGFEAARRENANFKDLNRNFPDFTSDPRDTPDGREVETKAIMALHKEHHFVLAMNFHGGTVCMNLPWDTQSNSNASRRFGDVELLRKLSVMYASTNAEMYANHGGSFNRGITYGYEWYEVDGGMQDWANFYRRSIHATAELSHAKFPAGSTLAAFWQSNRRGMLDYLNGGIFGHFFQVVDSKGQPVPSVEVRIDSAERWVRYDNGIVMKPVLENENGVWIRGDGLAAVRVNKTARWYDGQLESLQIQ